MEEVAGGGGRRPEGVNPDCPNAGNPFHRCAEYCPVPAPRGAAAKSPPPSRAAQNGHGKGIVLAAGAGEAGERGRSGGRSPARGGEDGGGGQWRAVNPDCPNADNPFHRCAEYCPVPAPRAVAKSPPPPPPPARSPRGHAAAQNGTAHGGGAERVVAGVADLEVSERTTSAAPPATDEGDIAHAAGPEESERTTSAPPPATEEVAIAHAAGPEEEEGERTRSSPPPATEEEVIAHVADTEEEDERTRSAPPPATDEVVTAHVADAGESGERRKSPRPPATGSGERKWQAVNPDCPNAGNPFHRCAEYCPVPVPRGAAKLPPPPGRGALNERTHSDGDLHPRPRRRDKGGGSGGLPLYVFLREGSDGDGKKVDPRCPNAPNPFHVCTDHCLAKIADAGRSSEGGKSPISLFSRHSRRSSSSSEEGSVKSTDSRKVDPKCPNAGNPFHECGEYCAAKMQQVEQQKGTKMKSPRKKGKDVAVLQNWKVDPRCPNASNPFHICAQYCFDHLSETTQTTTSKSDKKKGKAISDEELREVNPDCVNASNPYHKCGEHCKRKGDR